MDGSEAAQVLRRARADRRWSRRELARHLRAAAARREEYLPDDEHLVRSIRRWESGEVRPNELSRALLVDVYGLPAAALGDHLAGPAGADVETLDELDPELFDLGLRAEASDVGRVALEAVDVAVADLACRYAHTPPVQLLGAVRRRAGDVVRLLDGRSTLAQRRRLLIAGGWLSLLAATVHVDLGHRLAARLARDTAASLGREAGHPELVAWAVEVAAWEAIVDRDWTTAVDLARAGLDVAPAGGSAAVQLAAQYARAAARLGEVSIVHAALDRAEASLTRANPDGLSTDHHFVFDPAKLTSYTATALSWLGDPAAEDYARQVIDTARSDRRRATARIDLALVLTRLDRPDEAGALGALAVDSRRLVPSNVWRAGELDGALAGHLDTPQAADFHGRYLAARAVLDAERSTDRMGVLD